MNRNRRKFLKNSMLAAAGLELMSGLPGIASGLIRAFPSPGKLNSGQGLLSVIGEENGAAAISGVNQVPGLDMSATHRETEQNIVTALQDDQRILAPFRISLAEWSLHRALQAREMTNLDFPVKAALDFGIFGVEYVSTFFPNTRNAYLAELLGITKDHDVQNVLIMVDGEGNLGDPDSASRLKAVERHHRWVAAARFLGCHSIRVNARGEGTESEVGAASVDALSKLADYASDFGINVVVENHGGYSSKGNWLSDVISGVGMPNCGTLPDFGNFNVSNNETYDRYLGVEQIMPFAKGVSAKSYVFDAVGNEANFDYDRLIRIVYDAGYRGWIGIEYEGSGLSETEGILATKRLLERIFSGYEKTQSARKGT